MAWQGSPIVEGITHTRQKGTVAVLTKSQELIFEAFTLLRR